MSAADLSYSSNVDAGTATVDASFAGSQDYNPSDASTSFVIARAGTSVVVDCPLSVVFDGTAQEPCSANVVDAATGQTLSTVDVTYSSNVGAGTATVVASFAGSQDYNPSTASASFVIAPADTSVLVDCPSSVTFSDSAQEPCSANAVDTATGQVVASAALSYSSNVHAGTATVDASYAGSQDYNPSTASASFVIARAGTSVVVDCPLSVTFSGSAQEPCSANAVDTATGQVVASTALSYSSNVHAGTATVIASFAGSQDYNPSTASASFVIDPADTSVVVSCPVSVVFDGSSQEPCSVDVHNAVSGEWVDSVPASYSSNVDAGTASVDASYMGSQDYNPSTGSGSFVIIPASLTVRADSPSDVSYGAGVPSVGFSVDQLVSWVVEPTCSVFSRSDVAFATPLTGAINAGSYVTHCSGGTAANYTQAFVDGSFVVEPVSVTVAAKSPANSEYGQIVSATGYTADQAVAWDVEPSCSVFSSADSSFATPLAGVLNVGSYVTHCSGGVAANYAPVYADGSFTVSLANTSIHLVCPSSLVFDGAPQEPCSATVVSGVTGEVVGDAVLSYSSNEHVGAAVVGATYGGSSNYGSSTAAGSFAITPASVRVTADSPSAVSAGQIVAPIGFTTDVAVSWNVEPTCAVFDPTDAGFSVPMHSPLDPGSYVTHCSGGTAADHIATFVDGAVLVRPLPAQTTVSVTCPVEAIPFDGTAHDACSAQATSSDGFSQDLSVTYSPNVHVGTVQVTSSFAGDAQHQASVGSSTFQIAKATSQTTVTCPASAPFSGSALAPCTASAVGSGGLSQALEITYANNVAVGTATASAAFAGDADHESSSSSATFEIASAPVLGGATVTASSPASQTAGSTVPAITFTSDSSIVWDVEPTCAVFAADDTTFQSALSGSLGQGAYVTHCDGGTANGYEISYVDGGFTVAATLLSTTVVITCPSESVPYTGAELTPCTASATASDGFTQSLPIVYADNVDVGTASATAEFAGDSQHASATELATFNIGQAASETTVTCPVSVVVTGKAQTPCSAEVTGAGGLQASVPVAYSNNVQIGSATASANYAGDRNHSASSATKTFSINSGFVTNPWPSTVAPLSFTSVFAQSSTSQLTLKTQSPKTCVINGGTVYFLGIGTCSVTVLRGTARIANLSTRIVKGASASSHIARQTVSNYLFNPGSSVLSPTLKHRLTASVPSLKRARAVLVYGFSSGSSATAKKLSAARTAAVVRYLEALGVKVLLANSYGSTNDIDSSANRDRVVVGSASA